MKKTVNISKNKSNMLESVLTVGVFATLVYFVFFSSRSVFGQKGDSQTLVGSPMSHKIDSKEYEGRKKYYDTSASSATVNRQNYIHGFDMPNTIEGINFINGKISVITKPGTTTFEGVKGRSLIELSKNGNNLVYDGYIHSPVMKRHVENYEDVKDLIVLRKNTYLK